MDRKSENSKTKVTGSIPANGSINHIDSVLAMMFTAAEGMY